MNEWRSIRLNDYNKKLINEYTYALIIEKINNYVEESMNYGNTKTNVE